MVEKPQGVDPEGFERRVEQHLEWLRVHNYTEQTVWDRKRCLAHFVRWCVDRGLVRPSEATKPILERYQAALFHAMKKDGEPHSLYWQRNHLVAVKGLYKWLARGNYVLYNPASDLVLPRMAQRLPKNILTQEEVERVINVADVATPLGLRDRAILETFYSTGMRRMELIALSRYDIDPGRGTVMIRQGKGQRQRVVPIGERALRWVEKYQHEVRPLFVVEPDEGVLFLTHEGTAFAPNFMSELIRGYLKRAEVPKNGATHLFRHTMATLMLENGADVRFVQAMLGHARLDTTGVYTQVSIRKLKEIHTATHPARAQRATEPPTAAPPETSPEPEGEDPE